MKKIIVLYGLLFLGALQGVRGTPRINYHCALSFYSSINDAIYKQVLNCCKERNADIAAKSDRYMIISCSLALDDDCVKQQERIKIAYAELPLVKAVRDVLPIIEVNRTGWKVIIGTNHTVNILDDFFEEEPMATAGENGE